MVDLRVTGDKALIRKLERMPVSVQRQIGRKAIRPAGQMVSKAMKKAVPKISVEEAAELLNKPGAKAADAKRLTAHVRKGIGRKTKTYRHSGTVLEAVGPRWDYRQEGLIPAAWFAERLELGDAENVRAHAFMRKTARSVGPAAMSAMLSRVKALVEEEARRGGT